LKKTTKILASNRITKTKRKPASFNLKPIVVFFSVLGLALTIYIGYRTSISDRKLFSVSLLALFAGLLFESFRVSNKWKNVIYIFVGAYFFSLLNFLPGKNEKIYDFENHIETWPYLFIIFFALAFAIINKDKVTAKLSEGITLLLSLSLIYWIIDYGFINYQNWYAIPIVTIIFIISAFSILNALTNMQLSRTTRLILSVWSTIIMFAFATDNIIRVFSNQDIESSIYLSQGLYIGLQYFFLGISAVYLMQNYMLLIAFLPDKGGNYKNDLKENMKDHIARYSDKQVSIGNSLFCILYSGLMFGLNYKYQVLPRNTMIWIVLLTFPLILQLIVSINGRKNYS
jgi:hypothetical protein